MNILKKLKRKLKQKQIFLGIYGPTNVGKTTLANKMAQDWSESAASVGTVSEIPHETRSVQKLERMKITTDGHSLDVTLLDMPGISTKIDYRNFIQYGLSKEEALQRAKEATKGVVEAIKWLDHVDVAISMVDATRSPLEQVNLIIIGNLEAKKIPTIIIANKVDLPQAKPELVSTAFPDHTTIGLSALTGLNISALYKAIVDLS